MPPTALYLSCPRPHLATIFSLKGAIITLLFTLLFGCLYVFPPGPARPSLMTNTKDDLDDGITTTLALYYSDASETPRLKRRLLDIRLFSRKRNEYKVWSLNARQKLLRDGDSIGSSTD